jgi:hypothetical protein
MPETLEFFYYKNNSKPEKGFTGECRACAIKRSRTWVVKNFSYNANYKKEWNKDEKNNENQKRHYKQWREENHEHKREYEINYYNENPEKFQQYRQYWKMHKSHEITEKEWIFCKENFNNECAYCGLSLEEHYKLYNQDFHKEHAINDGENDLTNCIPSCKSCNSLKGTLDFDVWYIPGNNKYQQERYNKIIKWLMEDNFKNA